MGGKQKQANRTKGNVRPSSSARAAEQLSASGASTTGFIGFGALSGDLGYVPTTQGNEEADSSVDGDFRMILRKLSKRDATTKLKALQELVVLIREKEEEEVKTILPFWPRVYNKVSLDNDRRVRESLQETFEVLVCKVRRSLAPHLKLLMGSWLVAQNDVYAPAASCAKSAFQAAFPPAKQAEAVNFCKDEIMLHIHDNLLNQTPASLSDPKTTDPEDMDNKYQKMVSATLLAWRMLMSALRPDQLADLNDHVLPVLTDNKLWKHVKSTNPMIQGAFYSLIAGLCQYNAEMAQQVADKVCPTVLGNLSETEPTVCPHLWEAVLSTITAIPDCWSRVNARKAVWPKLWTLMANAGSGSASAIYPNMLPLLSKVTPEVMGTPVKFYNEFFSNMKQGLKVEKTKASHSEMAAVVNALLECLRYCLVHHLASDEESKLIQDFLINEQLLPLIEVSIVDKNAALATSPLYDGVVNLLTFLNKLATSPEFDDDTEDKAKAAEAGRVLDTVWTSLQNTLKTHIETVQPDHVDILERVAALLMAFRNPVKMERKKSRVRFSECDNKVERSQTPAFGVRAKSSMLKKTPSVTTPSKDWPAGTLAFMSEDSPLTKLVCDTCRIAHDRYHNDKSPEYLQYLSQMFCVFLSDHLLRELFALSQGTGATLGDNQTRLEFFQLVLVPWLSKVELWTGKEAEAERGSLIEMTVTLVRRSPVPENLAILELITKLDERLLGLVSQRVLLLTAEDSAVARWFRGPVFGERVVGVARALCEQTLQAVQTDDQLTAARWDLLTLALSSMDNQESVLGEDYVDQMLTEMRQSLPATAEQKSLTPEQVNRCVTFVCDVSTNFYSNIKGCLLVASAEALLASLFTLSCQHNPIITDAVNDKVYAAWQLGVRALLSQRGGYLSDNSFFAQVATQLKAQVLTEGVTFKRLKRLGNLAVSLCRTMAEETGDDDSADDNLYNFRRMLYTPCDHTNTSNWWAYLVISDQMTFASRPSDLDPVSVKVIPKDVRSAIFSSFILEDAGLTETLPTSSTSEMTPDDDAEKKCTEEYDLVRDIVYATGICRCILGGQKQALASTEIGLATAHLESSLVAILQRRSKNFEEVFLLPLLNRSLDDGQLWAVAVRTLFNVVPGIRWSSKLTSALNPSDRLNSLTEASLQTLQVAVHFMPPNELRPLVDMVAAQVITCPQETLTKIDGALGLLSLLVLLLEAIKEPFGGIEGEERSRPTDVMISVLDEVKLWRDQVDGLFAFEESSSLETHITFNLAAMQLMRQTVAVGPSVMTHAHWDFVLCSMVAWVQALEEMKSRMLSDVLVQAFGAVLSQLVTGVATCIRHVLPAQPEAFPPDLATEWADFFSEGTFSLLLPVFLDLTEKMDLAAPTAAEAELLTQVCAAISLCPAEQLRNHKLAARLVADQESALPDELQTLLNTLCPLLGSPARPVQVAAYRLLHAVIADLAAFDLNIHKEEDDQKEEVSRSPPLALVSVLETSGSLVKLLVAGLRPGDRVTSPPHSHEYTASMAYLLSWKLMLAFFRAAPSELRAQYSLCLRDMGAVDSLLTNLFHLMPENPVVTLKDSLTSTSTSQKLGSTCNMFSEPPRLDPTVAALGEEVQHSACTVYAQALQDVPAMVRTWWTNQDRRTAEIVDRFTTKFVSPIQVAAEMAAMKQQQLEMDNMTILVRPAAREVAATYVLDEMSIELVVTLPVNHPLGVISVETGKRIGVANTQWRNWMLQMVTFLNHQNGSIVEGLMLWKRNVDKRFEGLDDCLICFSVIHGSNYQLPRLTCKVCKKKFHSACLYKWFNTSNNSSCPLCRSLF